MVVVDIFTAPYIYLQTTNNKYVARQVSFKDKQAKIAVYKKQKVTPIIRSIIILVGV